MKKHNVFFLVLALFTLSACSPLSAVTTVPAVALGAYESTNKRKDLEAYASKGDVYAQYDLAHSYCCKPYEGETNHALAMEWYCMAARNGFAKAQVEVAKIYLGERKMDGVAIQYNPSIAYAWLSLASRRASEEAFQLIKPLKSSMTNEELTLATRYLQDTSSLPCAP